jgi:AbrB family looped-hinge helix DNA binding protein
MHSHAGALARSLVRRYLTCMRTTVSSKGQIVLPAELREEDRIRPGQQFEVERVKRGQYLLKRVSPSGDMDFVDWLLACPEKDWFEPIPSELTDEIAPLDHEVPRGR